ncbi:hypothetical protein BDC45DRAFT_511427 [Circinella umbellata]|nr:hypothetical protein BDC45DRAFT_515525 [Circinella umbellata]KAI7853141.1 hypothetical protein BDC45DRAFT_511427 [Circinella umbellata]
MNVTKQQALCMFHCEEYTNDNVIRLQKRLEEMEDLELCYRDDPTDPVMVSKRTIDNNPEKYHLYTSSNCAGNGLNYHSR